MDQRLTAMKQWLALVMDEPILELTTASTDASFRRYFRVTTSNKTYIVMDAPPEQEDIDLFVKVGNIFGEAGTNVPTTYQANLEQGFLLLQDFGNINYLDKLTANSADTLYMQALDCLYTLQKNTSPLTTALPVYSSQLLHTEMELFREWFLVKLLKQTLNPEIANLLDQVWQLLIESALLQPQVCVHRDYHSRNLMYLQQNNPGVIDFQDAVIGPITYDLVSLLRDCYISWPDQQVYHWLANYYDKVSEAGLVKGYPFEVFARWFDLMGLQRHIKAIGIFSRLQIRDGKPQYLKDIPRTMQYVIQISQKYKELKPLHDFVTQQVVTSRYFPQ